MRKFLVQTCHRIEFGSHADFRAGFQAKNFPSELTPWMLTHDREEIFSTALKLPFSNLKNAAFYSGVQALPKGLYLVSCL